MQATLGSSQSQLEERVIALQRELDSARGDAEAAQKVCVHCSRLHWHSQLVWKPCLCGLWWVQSLRSVDAAYSNYKAQSEAQVVSLREEVDSLRATVRTKDGKISELQATLDRLTAELKAAAEDLRHEQ